MVSVTDVNVVKRFMIQSTSLNEGLFCHIKCACVWCLCYLETEPGALTCLCFEELLFWFGRFCPCLYIRWGLHGIMIIIINSGENQWRKWYFKSTDIIKRHQRDKCCLDVCWLVGNKQVFLWSGSRMEKTGTIFFVARNCAALKVDSRTNPWHSDGVKILK